MSRKEIQNKTVNQMQVPYTEDIIDILAYYFLTTEKIGSNRFLKQTIKAAFWQRIERKYGIHYYDIVIDGLIE